MSSQPPYALLRAELKHAKELNAELVRALEELSAMYGHSWDRSDGALMMMGSSIPRFEAAHDKARAVLAKAKAQP